LVVVKKPWLTVAETAEILEKKRSTIYEQIRTGIFPFEYRRAGTSILISARDLGVLAEVDPKNSEAQGKQVDSLLAAA
jgi:hypothetical protein